jgi:hypothetical protein
MGFGVFTMIPTWGSNSPWPKQTSRSLACLVEEAHGNQSEGYKILEVERGGGGGLRRRAISAGPEDAQKGKDLASW